MQKFAEYECWVICYDQHGKGVERLEKENLWDKLQWELQVYFEKKLLLLYITISNFINSCN